MAMFTYWEADERKFKTYAAVEDAIRMNPFDWPTRVEVARVSVEMDEETNELFLNKEYMEDLYSEDYQTEEE